LTQPVCLVQAVPSNDSNDLQGQPVVLSSYIQALAGAPTSLQVTAYVIYGTGSNQGFSATPTASPAITPAWTGLATAGSQTFTTTTSWARYQTSPIIIPLTATEVGVEFCFTPGAETAGVTDGFAFTGLQLEQSSVAASPFEFRSYTAELARALQYAYVINEPAANVILPAGVGQSSSTTVCQLSIPFPTMMRAAPTYTSTLSATTFKVGATALAPIALATPFAATATANTQYGASINFTTGASQTANAACGPLFGAGGGGSMVFSADL
jgi:hypothetical protein